MGDACCGFYLARADVAQGLVDARVVYRRSSVHLDHAEQHVRAIEQELLVGSLAGDCIGDVLRGSDLEFAIAAGA